MITRRQAYNRLGLILAIFLALSLAHSIWLPLHEAPDELAHFQYSRFIARTGRLPLTAGERVEAGYLSFWPPLYHAVVALATGWSDRSSPPRLKFVWESPRFNLASELLDTKRLANTEDELWPYQGMVLIWHLARVVSIIISMGTIVVVFFTTLEILPHQYRLATLAAAIVAFGPAYLFISASISYEPLLGLLTGLYFWVLIKLMKGKAQLRYVFWLGLLMGLAVTAKYAAVILPLQVVAVFTFLAWRHGWGWAGWFKRLGLTALAAILASGWWFLFLIINFNQIAQFGPIIGSLKPIIAGGIDTSQNYTAYLLTGGQIGSVQSLEIVPDSFGNWLGHMYQSFWVTNIGGYPLGPLVYTLVGVVWLVGIISMAQAWHRRPATRVWLILLISQACLFVVFPLLRFLIQGKVTWTAQGRHVLFPMATALPLLMIYGWQGWLSSKTRHWLALALVAGLVSGSLAQLIRVATYYPPPLPIRTTPEAVAQIPYRLDQPFSDHLILRGYAWQVIPTANTLKLSLYWQAPTYPDEDYLMQVRLVQNGLPRLNWLAYPIDGRYPTRIWESWELIRDDLVLPLFDLPAGQYEVQLQVRGAEGAVPVNKGDHLVVAKIDIPETSPLKMHRSPGGWADIFSSFSVDSNSAGVESQLHLPVSWNGRELVSGLSLWQADRYRQLSLPRYRPRMAIPLVWQGQPADRERLQWLLVDPQGGIYPAQHAAAHFEYFLVKPDWPSGDYRLRVEVWRDDEVVASQETGPLVTIFNEKPRRLQPPPLAHPLAANFANQVKLLGYELPDKFLSPGQGIPLTLYWQGLRTMGQSYTIFTKLLDGHQRAWGQVERLPADGYNTIYWLENEVVVDGFELPVSPAIPAGIYWLNLGLYQEVNHTAVSLPLILNNQLSNVTSLSFGPIKVGGPPPGVVLSPQEAAPTTPLAIVLGEPPVIRLRGYDLAQGADTLKLRLYWESLAQTDINWNTFVHLRNQAGETLAQKDGPTGEGLYPTSLWEPGELIADEVTLSTAHQPEGGYNLVIGLYDLTSGQRLTVPTNPANEILLTGTITVN